MRDDQFYTGPSGGGRLRSLSAVPVLPPESIFGVLGFDSALVRVSRYCASND
jgi:hypothetical protein